MGDLGAQRRALDEMLQLLSTFDVAVQRRLVALLQVNTGAAPISDRNGGSGAHGFHSVREFIEFKAPRTATERLACLLYWAETHDGDTIVPVRRLNDLNREASGRTFSDASSVAQAAIAKHYLLREWPGHLSLTVDGRVLVAALPGDSDATQSNGDWSRSGY